MAGYESWIDRQIREAQERGEFDNLRGAGKPIKGLGGREDENWWIKGLIERENMRPPSCRARCCCARRPRRSSTPSPTARTEEQVREIVRT